MGTPLVVHHHQRNRPMLILKKKKQKKNKENKNEKTNLAHARTVINNQCLNFLLHFCFVCLYVRLLYKRLLDLLNERRREKVSKKKEKREKNSQEKKKLLTSTRSEKFCSVEIFQYNFRWSSKHIGLHRIHNTSIEKFQTNNNEKVKKKQKTKKIFLIFSFCFVCFLIDCCNFQKQIKTKIEQRKENKRTREQKKKKTKQKLKKKIHLSNYFLLQRKTTKKNLSQVCSHSQKQTQVRRKLICFQLFL